MNINLTQSSSPVFEDSYFTSLIEKNSLPKDREAFLIKTNKEINYIFFYYSTSYVLIGPYTTSTIIDNLQIPIVKDPSIFNQIINTLFSKLWEGEKYIIKYINDFEDNNVDAESIDFLDIMSIEKRYRDESRLLEAVKSGDIELINHIVSNFDNKISLEKRNKNPVRNIQNYTIIMNTLMRKTAYDAGVPPIYVDKISSKFGKKIECISTSDASKSIMKELLYEYSNLIRTYSFIGYSESIRTLLTFIDFSYSTRLSLSNLANKLNVSPSYLSKRFKKELGISLFEYITKVRIEKSKSLLKDKNISIVDVAIRSGFEDQAYYARTFKKIMGLTPTQYRKLNIVVK